MLDHSGRPPRSPSPDPDRKKVRWAEDEEINFFEDAEINFLSL
jgi:hypothetical protein